MSLGPTPDLPLPPGEDPPAPPNSATPQDLGAHPGLARLLRNLGGLLGGDGLSPHLQKELRQAEEGLWQARGLWLRRELLWRLLGELIRDPRDCDPAVLRALEQELTWAQVRRGPPDIARLVPRPQPLGGLLPELQRRLREKRDELRNFLLGPPKNPQNPPKNAQNASKIPQIHPKNPPIHPKKTQNPPNLGGLLGAQRFRLLRERRRQRLLGEKLDWMGWKYPQVLWRCRSHLCHLRSLGRLQAHLDGGRGQYLQAKGGAVLLKSRLEELRVLLDTYPAPTIEAHRRIRAGLSEQLSSAHSQAAILGAELGAFRALGPEFRDLAREFGQIREESTQKRWALRQLRPPPP